MLAARFRSFRENDSGLTLVESTFIMFILLLVMVNGTELDRYARFARHLEFAAQGLAVLTGQRVAPMRDADWSSDAAFLFWLYPEAAASDAAQWRNVLGVQTTLVRFEPSDPACADNCTFSAARVLWTWSGGTAGSRALLEARGVLRTCGMLLAGSDTPAAQTLPANLFRGGKLLVVTLVHDYTPYFPLSFVGARPLVREAYLVPASGDLPVDPFGGANEVTPCP